MDNFENNQVQPENPETEVEKEKLTGWKKELLEWVKAIVIAVVVATLLNQFVLKLARVSGNSMLPTLHDGEMLYVNRLMYEPEKGDIIILQSEKTNGKAYIKRVIATEGDTVYIDFDNGDVYVNDEVIEEDYIYEPTNRSGSYVNSLRMSGNYSKDNPIVVEKDKVFVMGDNRNNSSDSREIGQVAEKDVMGHAVFRFWPLNAIGGLD